MPIQSVRLLVEIADTTLENDVGRKAALYAENDVAEYWVIDLKGRRLHQLWLPRSGSYSERRELPLGRNVDAVTISGLTVALPDPS